MKRKYALLSTALLMAVTFTPYKSEAKEIKFQDYDWNISFADIEEASGKELIRYAFKFAGAEELYRTKTSHTENGISTLKTQYFSQNNTIYATSDSNCNAF